MIAIATALAAILLSLLISRVATVAFVLTGLSKEAARFQARSALSGTGFTTTEAEGVVNHPARRRIVMLLMLFGSAGLVTVIASLMLSFARADRGQAEIRILMLLAGLFVVWLAAQSAIVDRWLTRAVAVVLTRWTGLDARDYHALLHLSDRFVVTELRVADDAWIAGRTLGELRLRDEGVVVLGATLADGAWLGAPTFETRLHPGERLVVYGPAARVAEVSRRKTGGEGDRAHAEAVAEHRRGVAAAEREHTP